ncbi:MAG: hypothetical protein JWP97_1545 [Labilithrix sp.]|nr:hypothetical protein [Labilithrix sp.]
MPSSNRVASSLLSVVAPCALALFGLFASTPARAQTTGVAVTITNATSLARVDPNGNSVTKRPLIMPEGINLQDCRDNLELVFPLTVTGFATTNNFEVWGTDQSGADCTQATARSGATQTCYPVAANFARTQTQSVRIPIKELIKGINPTDVGSDGCRRVNAYTISVYFLVLAGTDVTGNAKTTLSVDTQGPTGLSGVHVLPGNEAVSVRWTAQGEGGADDVIGAQAFCDPNPVGSTASIDAGATTTCTDDAGMVVTDVDASDPAALAEAGVTCTTVANEGGTSAGSGTIPAPGSAFSSDGEVCTTAAFAPVNGEPLVADQALIDKYGCGRNDSNTGSEIRIGSIGGAAPVNGKVYAVTIAAIDSFGNLGELSETRCQFPEETTDFWRDYRGSGGESGGGFCATSAPGFPAGSFGLLALGVVIGLSSARRIHRSIGDARKRRRSSR